MHIQLLYVHVYIDDPLDVGWFMQHEIVKESFYMIFLQYIHVTISCRQFLSITSMLMCITARFPEFLLYHVQSNLDISKL